MLIGDASECTEAAGQFQNSMEMEIGDFCEPVKTLILPFTRQVVALNVEKVSH